MTAKFKANTPVERMITISVSGNGKIMYKLNGVLEILGMNESVTVPSKGVSLLILYDNEEFWLGWYRGGSLVTKDHSCTEYLDDIEARFTGTGGGAGGGGGLLPPIEMD